MAGQRQKAPADLAFKRATRGRVFEVEAKPGKAVPPAPEGLSEYAREVWRGYWASWVSDAVVYEAHAQRLLHWIRCVDERHKLWPQLTAAPVVTGAKGQPVLNPLSRRVRELTHDIERAEEAFGMTPLASWRMQLTSTTAQRSAIDLRRELVQERPQKVINLDELG